MAPWELSLRFEGRVLSIDEAVAEAWGRIAARRERLGRRIEPMDACVAAVAEVHPLTLVTRNTADFESAVESLISPWSP